MSNTYTLKEIRGAGGHQVGVQLAMFTSDYPFAKLEIPSGVGGEVSLETLIMMYTFLRRIIPKELR